MNISKKTQNIICFVIIVAAIIVMIVLLSEYKKSKESSVDGQDITQTAVLQPKEDKVRITVNTEIIQDGLEDMGFLVTQEYYFTQVETYTKEKKVWFFDATSELAYSYEGSVTAGVDFSKIKVSKDEESKTITVDVPEAEIQTVIIDKNSFKVFEEKESMWNKFNIMDYNNSLIEYENAARDKAVENGVLDRAEEQAHTLVLNFVKSYDSSGEYKIVCE